MNCLAHFVFLPYSMKISTFSRFLRIINRNTAPKIDGL